MRHRTTATRGAARLLGTLMAAGFALSIAGCGDTEGEVTVEPAAANERGSGVERGGGSGSRTVEGTLSRVAGPGYDRLLEATRGIPPNPMVGTAARLSRARDWVDANFPDKPPRERELQSQLIAVMESILSDEVGLDAFGSINEFQALELWSRDADGDGTLSVDEAVEQEGGIERTMGDALMFFGDRFDTDGDGTISNTEMNAADNSFEAGVAPVIMMLIDRSTIRAWDEDGDGVLSDSEREAGHLELGIGPDDPRLEIESPDERYGLYLSLAEGFEQASALLPWGDPSEQYRAIQASIPAEPRQDDFDFDGDGVLSEVETAALRDEQIAWNQEREAVMRRMEAAGVQASYAVAIDRMDTDGDGGIAEQEWIAGFATLRAERDARLFNHFYDTDSDGSISDLEVVRFMNAYENRSLHADVDMNGVVDQADLLAFRDRALGG